MVPLIIMLGSPLWTALADATDQHRSIMSATILVTALAASQFPLVHSFSGIIPLVILYALCAAPIIPFADSATMAMLGEDKEMYGRVRLGGTIGWGAVALLAGAILEAYGIRWAFWCYAAIMIFTLLVSLKFTYPKKKQASWVGGLRVVLADKRWVVFLILAFVAGLAFAVLNSYLFPYLEELNINNQIRYIAITISTISELPVLFFANRLLRRFKPLGLLEIGMAITGLRLLLYAAFNFQAGILAFQFLNGMTFPLFLVAGVAYANEISPEGIKATGQGLFGAMVAGFGSAMGNLAGGFLLGSIGGRGLFLVAGVFVAASLWVIHLVMHYQQRRALPKLG